MVVVDECLDSLEFVKGAIYVSRDALGSWWLEHGVFVYSSYETVSMFCSIRTLVGPGISVYIVAEGHDTMSQVNPI